MTSGPRPGSARLDQLTSLRFFAAGLVLLHHFIDFKAGYAGVTFFYVLSGFILMRTYDGRVHTTDQRRDFWVKRFARVYPMHFLTFLAAIPLIERSSMSEGICVGAANLTLLHALVPSWSAWFSFNAVSWTISAEAFYYAFFPILAVHMVKRPAAKAMVAMALVVGLAAAWTAVTNATLADSATRYLFYISPFLRISEFLAGMAIASATKGRSIQSGTRLELGAIVLASASLLIAPIVQFGAFSASLIFVPASVSLVYVFAVGNGAISSFLRWRPLVLLGEASFVLYMIHWLVRAYLGDSLGAWPAMLLSIAISIPIHLLVERPSREWVVARSQRPPSSPLEHPAGDTSGEGGRE